MNYNIIELSRVYMAKCRIIFYIVRCITSYCELKAMAGNFCRFKLKLARSFRWIVISRLASCMASHSFACDIIWRIKSSTAGSEFKSSRSPSVSSKPLSRLFGDACCCCSTSLLFGRSGTDGSARFRPHPVNALQNGRFFGSAYLAELLSVCFI